MIYAAAGPDQARGQKSLEKMGFGLNPGTSIRKEGAFG